jgi:hypothetical protein
MPAMPGQTTLAAFAPPTVQANPAYAQAQQAVNAAQVAAISAGQNAPITQSIANTFYSNNGQQAAIAAQQAAAAKNAEAHQALQDAIATLNATPKTLSIPGKPISKSTRSAQAPPMSIGAGLSAAQPGLFGFAKSTPSPTGKPGTATNGARGYTVNPNGTTTYSTGGGSGSHTFSISGGIGGMPGSVGGAGVGYGAFGIGAPASAGWAYGGPTSNVGW